MSSIAPLRRKLVIVGDGACGKTSLLCVFANGEFPKKYVPTIFENYVAEISLDGKAVQLALWDTAGQEEYERLRPLSYAQSHVVVIAFSIDTPDSLDNVETKWAEEVRNINGTAVPVLFVGCKRDLRDSYEGEDKAKKFVTTAQGQHMSSSIGARAYFECSALLNSGVDEIFEAATRAAMLVRTLPSGKVGPNAKNGDPYLDGNEKRRRASGGFNEDKGSGCCVVC